MFKIVVDFLNCNPGKKQYSKMTNDQIYEYLSYEARLTIFHDNQIIFSEEIAIIEFYQQLVIWHKGYKSGNRSSFLYTTVEHIAPILEFCAIDGSSWKIDSIWKRCYDPIIVDNLVFSNEIDALISFLNAVLEY